jgi:hydrogenase-4 component E
MNKNWLELIFVAILVTDLALLGSSRFRILIRTVTVQGVLLGILPLLTGKEGLTLRPWGLAVGVVFLKGLVLPMLLQRARKVANVQREVDPLVGYSLSMLIGILALAFSIWMGFRLPLPVSASSRLVVPVALFTLWSGLFLIVARKKALTQVIGYLTMENGIYTFGVALAYKEHMLVELGVLLDMFVGIFVMGIAIFHISREFDHIDTHRLAQLEDWSQVGQASGNEGPLLGEES